MKKMIATWVVLLIASTPLFALASYDLSFSNNVNVPHVSLTNTSTAGEQIVSFRMTIGNTSFNFDGARLISTSGISSTLNAPDTNTGGGARANFVDYSFSGFGVGETFVFDADVDIDSADTGEDYRVVLFNNGSNPNSVITVGFSSGTILQQTLPDGSTTASTYNFSNAQEVVVPEPTSMLLLLVGLCIGGLYRRSVVR